MDGSDSNNSDLIHDFWLKLCFRMPIEIESTLYVLRVIAQELWALNLIVQLLTNNPYGFILFLFIRIQTFK